MLDADAVGIAAEGKRAVPEVGQQIDSERHVGDTDSTRRLAKAGRRFHLRRTAVQQLPSALHCMTQPQRVSSTRHFPAIAFTPVPWLVCWGGGPCRGWSDKVFDRPGQRKTAAGCHAHGARL